MTVTSGYMNVSSERQVVRSTFLSRGFATETLPVIGLFATVVIGLALIVGFGHFFDWNAANQASFGGCCTIWTGK